MTFLYVPSFLSLSMGLKQGFLNVKWGLGMRALSPLLFCIAEDVLNRAISSLVEVGKLDLIKGPRGSFVHSHALYADDIMLFCKAKRSNVEALKNMFFRYAQCFGQRVNPNKSTLFADSIPQPKISGFAQSLSFLEG